MKRRRLTDRTMKKFEEYLREEEKSKATIEKYIHDIRMFVSFTNHRNISKKIVMQYKRTLFEKAYAVASIHSMLAPLNSLFSFLGWTDCKIKSVKIQRQIYCSKDRELTKEEYMRLVHTSKQKGKERLGLLLQAICGTGIRVSELQFITAEAAKRGKADVFCKGKTRSVFIVPALQKKLLRYAAEQKISSGPIFITRSGNPVSRTNIWREMKSLCTQANVRPEKVFPHNLRHLFARVFYDIEKDMAKLADILGHSSIDTTRIYIISTGAEHRRKMEHMRLII